MLNLHGEGLLQSDHALLDQQLEQRIELGLLSVDSHNSHQQHDYY